MTDQQNKSTLSIELLRKYAADRKTFIETGTAKGEGVQVALDFGQFDKIVSIEANADVYAQTCKRFTMHSNVLLAMGGSTDVLPYILKDIKEPVVFWLDAHWSTGEDPLPAGVLPCPILAELRAIAEHPIKNHFIMIDDIRYFKTGIAQWQNITLGDIVDHILSINEDYWLTFEKGITEFDILVAEVKPKRC